MNIIKRIGNYVLKMFQDVVELVWMIGTAAAVFLMWIVFCTGVTVMYMLSRTMELFVPGVSDRIYEALGVVFDYFNNKEDSDAIVKEQED